MKRIRNQKAEGYIDVCVLVLCAMLVIGLTMRLFPIFMAKSRLDTFANELCREAEISGRVGTETTRRKNELNEKTGLNPNIQWSKTGPIQLNKEVQVTLKVKMELGLFGGFGSFPVELKASATGRSEVYWK